MPFILSVGTILTLSWCLYFTPYMVALGRGHRSTLAISMVNLFFGWIIFGWIAALIWACTNPSGNQPQIIVNTGDNAAIIPAAPPNQGKGGRIVVLLLLLATLGYLSAFAINAVGTGIRSELTSYVNQKDVAAKRIISTKEATPDDQSGVTPEQQANQADLSQPADQSPGSTSVAASPPVGAST